MNSSLIRVITQAITNNTLDDISVLDIIILLEYADDMYFNTDAESPIVTGKQIGRAHV